MQALANNVMANRLSAQVAYQLLKILNIFTTVHATPHVQVVLMLMALTAQFVIPLPTA